MIAFSLVQSGDSWRKRWCCWHGLLVQRDEPDQAQIQDGVTVNGGTNPNGAPVQGGAVNVEADDNTILVGVTGGAVTGNHIGVGFAIAVNDLNRNTTALIGSTSTPTKLGSFDISSLAVNATDEGQVGTLTYSAANDLAVRGPGQE